MEKQRGKRSPRRLTGFFWGAWDIWGLLSWVAGQAVLDPLFWFWAELSDEHVGWALSFFLGLSIILLLLTVLLIRMFHHLFGNSESFGAPVIANSKGVVSDSPNSAAASDSGVAFRAENIIGSPIIYLSTGQGEGIDVIATARVAATSALAKVAALRASGVKLRNKGLHWLIDAKDIENWWGEVKEWWNSVVATLAGVDQAEAEIFRVLNYLPTRQYPGIEIRSPQHLKYLQMFDELLVRHEATIRFQQSLRSTSRSRGSQT